MSETTLSYDCRKMANHYGILVRKVHAEGWRGWPDLELIFPFDGQTVRVEMKNPNGKGRTSALQREEHVKIRTQGGYVYVCKSKPEFRAIIEAHLVDEFLNPVYKYAYKKGPYKC